MMKLALIGFTNFFVALRLVAAGLADPFEMIGDERVAAYHDFQQYARSIGMYGYELADALYQAQYPLDDVESVEPAPEPIVYDDDWMTDIIEDDLIVHIEDSLASERLK